MQDIKTIKVPNELLNTHECEALVITCMDFRFWQATLTEFIKKESGIETFDVITVPGSCKALAENPDGSRDPVGQYILDVIALSKNLHGIKQVIFVNHATCGAYAISDLQKELSVQGEDLKKTRSTLKDLFPELSFKTFYAQKDIGEINYMKI